MGGGIGAASAPRPTAGDVPRQPKVAPELFSPCSQAGGLRRVKGGLGGGSGWLRMVEDG